VEERVKRIKTFEYQINRQLKKDHGEFVKMLTPVIRTSKIVQGLHLDFG